MRTIFKKKDLMHQSKLLSGISFRLPFNRCAPLHHYRGEKSCRVLPAVSTVATSNLLNARIQWRIKTTTNSAHNPVWRDCFLRGGAMMMKRYLMGVLLAAAVSAMGQVNGSTYFFRISMPSDGLITELDPVAGTIRWSNGMTEVTNQLQRSIDLTAPNGGWTDFVMLVSTDAMDCTEHIIDLDPPEGMVFIPGGMNCGTNPLAVGESYDQYYPSNYCQFVSAFYMDQCEVSKAQWDTVYNWAINNNYSFDDAGAGKSPDHPVHTVRWYDCVKWCNARSEMEGRTPCYTVGTSVYRSGQSAPDCDWSAAGYRLPTSDEWEMSARGGLRSERFGWGDTITHSNANYYSSSSYSYDASFTRGPHPDYSEEAYPYTSPVGNFAPNGYGLYDMEGNVWEWCWDWFPGYEGSERMQRGGCWSHDVGYCRMGTRLRRFPSLAYNRLGFRTVLSAN